MHEDLNENRYYQSGFFLCSYRFSCFGCVLIIFVVVWCKTCICIYHWRSIFRLFLEEFKVFVDKFFIGETAPLQYDLLDLLYCYFCYIFIFAELTCLQYWSPLWFAVDICFGCTFLCARRFDTVLGRYFEFSKKKWILFCDWSLN